MSLFPDTVRIIECEFGEDIFAYVLGYEHGLLKVRLDLDEDHPAMQDVIADGGDPSQAEIITYVPLPMVERT